MTDQIKVVVPNIGEASDVEVIEVLVGIGDMVNEGDSLITLESDKASMEVPSSDSGVVKEINIAIGDKVSEGSVILVLSSEDNKVSSQPTSSPDPVEKPTTETNTATVKEIKAQPSMESQKRDIVIPDIGDASQVDVIDILVSEGDQVDKEQALITLEGDKATMDIPSTFNGKVLSMAVKVGDKVSMGDKILTIETSQETVSSQPTAPSKKPEQKIHVATETEKKPETKSESKIPSEVTSSKAYASPSIRRLAREFGVDLTLVDGSGRKGRIVKADIQKFVKSRLALPDGNLGIPKIAKIDFSKFGGIDVQPLNKIKRLTAQNMQRSWLNVPHVTQFDEADITDLEAFRKANKERALQDGIKLTPLAFIVQAVVKALQAFPQFNSSLDDRGENLILKQYFNIGIAVDTPNGLVVPVIKDADQKGLLELAKDMGELSAKARKKALTPADMSGGCFTISSLGGIGGSAFTPIVNAPEVAILGVSRSQMKPVYDGKAFVPRLMLPLSLSYDHRVIDGAEAARFSNYLSQCLSDIRTQLL